MPNDSITDYSQQANWSCHKCMHELFPFYNVLTDGDFQSLYCCKAELLKEKNIDANVFSEMNYKDMVNSELDNLDPDTNYYT